MAVRTTVFGILMAAVVGVCGTVDGAVIAPVKAYVKPDEAVLVKFENEKAETGRKAVEALGWSATKMEDLFSPAEDVLDAHGAPRFSVYAFDGTKLDATPGKAEADGSMNIGAFFPQMGDGGTYILTWKDA